ncbi:hypothetical protein PGB90_004851 [Kerria lacca]
MDSSQDTTVMRRIKIPEGLDALLEQIIKVVLKIQPENLELFIADYLKKLIGIRVEGALNKAAEDK